MTAEEILRNWADNEHEVFVQSFTPTVTPVVMTFRGILRYRNGWYNIHADEVLTPLRGVALNLSEFDKYYLYRSSHGRIVVEARKFVKDGGGILSRVRLFDFDPFIGTDDPLEYVSEEG